VSYRNYKLYFTLADGTKRRAGREGVILRTQRVPRWNHEKHGLAEAHRERMQKGSTQGTEHLLLVTWGHFP